MNKKKNKSRKIPNKKTDSKAGRPKQSFKWLHPVSGKPIPATQYYKVVRSLSQKASQTIYMDLIHCGCLIFYLTSRKA